MRYIKRRRLWPRFHRRGKGKRKLPVFLSALLFLGAGLSELGLSSVSSELTEEAARGYILSQVNEAVYQELEDREGSFVSAQRGSDGEISSVSTDTFALNKLRAQVLERLNKTLNGKIKAGIPIGSLTEIGILNGRGFQVPLRLQLESSADVSFDTEFVSAGVNQTCHRVTMRINTRAFSQSKKFRVLVETETSTVLAETVVVGNVPNMAVLGG